MDSAHSWRNNKTQNIATKWSEKYSTDIVIYL